MTKTSKRGFKCIKGHKLANCFITWETKITNNVKEKGILFLTIDEVLEGKGEMDSKKYNDAIAQLIRTAPNNFFRQWEDHSYEVHEYEEVANQ